MTSPPAVTQQATAAMATPNSEDIPSSVELTAAHEAAQPATGQHAHDSSQETEDQRNDGGHEHEAGLGRVEELANGESSSAVEAAIPHDSYQDEPLASDFQPDPAQVAAQIEALPYLVEYPRPIPPYEPDPGLLNNPIATADTPPMDQAMDPHQPYHGASPYLREADETRIQAYAMLEFPDGQFYMNTYSVILGRDLAAARAAMRRDAELARQKEEEETMGEPKTPIRSKRDESKYTRSVVSESGGILRAGDAGDDSDSDDRAKRRKGRKASKKSKSTGSSSQRMSRRNSLAQLNGRIEYQAQLQVRRQAPDSSGAVPVDPASLRPSPHDCPLVGIHPPATTPASGFKAISRQHVKIAYNLKKNLFEAEIIGRNGAFVDDVFHHHLNVVELKSGSQLQIGGVVVRFILPDVAIGETGAEHHIDYDDSMVGNRYSEGGKEMSFDFEDTPRDGALVQDSSEESSEEEDGGLENEDDVGDGEDVEGEGSGDGDMENSGQSDGADGEEEEEEEEQEVREVREPSPVPPKRRGPGRPPKNGIMSKREQQLAKKEAQQKAKKTNPNPPTTGKNKVGRPRKHPRLETPPVKTEKRKYTKRKPKDPDAAIKQEGSQDEDKAAKEKKEKKSSRPPRSPTPVFNEADLTPEQLAKPQANYVTLIHEALSNSPTGEMSLPQIYRAIQKRYPFFVLKCNTNGWQSSVRHNLSQHHAFCKVRRDGKGWMWGIVEGVSIEKEKKRRPSPPHQLPPGHMHQQIYRAGLLPQHMVPRPPGMMGPPPGYPINGPMPPGLQLSQPAPYMGAPTNGYPLQGPHPPINGQHPPGFPGPPQMNPPLGPQSTSYSSPYAPKLTSNSTSPPNPSNMAPDNTLPTSGPPPPETLQQARPNYPQIPTQPNENIARALDTFKTALTASLKGKSNNAEAVVTSAINRVLGITSQSTVPGDPNEEKIMVATRVMLSKLPGANFPILQPPQPTPLHQQEPSLTPSQTPPIPSNENANPNQPSAPSNASKPSVPSIARPSFGAPGQNRPNGASTSVPRPPMMTPGMARTSSGSPANVQTRPGGATTSSASPVSTPASSAATANHNAVQKPSINDNGKRPLEDTEDVAERDFKRLSTAGPPPLKA
jgi:hypothetical protein